MHDGDTVLPSKRVTLTYPFEAAPPPGGALEIADGVKWMQMPMGGPLKAVNVYAIRDGDGYAVVDTGLQTRDTAALWRTVLAEALEGRPVTRVIITHMHPDHVGLAGWLARKFQCGLWMTRLEYVSCRMLVADTGREAPEDGVRFYRAAGFPEDAIENYRTRFGGFGKAVYALPDSYKRLTDGDVLSIGGREWRVVVGAGHSPEHACLWRPDDALFLSGDQVLPRISSNVSVHPTEPEADPLNDWLTTLAGVRDRVPDDVLVAPGHNEPFRGLHARIGQLIDGHETSLTRLRRSLREPKRAVDVFGALFARPIGPELLGMATGESLAHLNHLIARGHAVRERDGDGVDWYRAAGS